MIPRFTNAIGTVKGKSGGVHRSHFRSNSISGLRGGSTWQVTEAKKACTLCRSRRVGLCKVAGVADGSGEQDPAAADAEEGKPGVAEDQDEEIDLERELNEDFLMAILCLEEWRDCQMVFDALNSSMFPSTLVALLVQLAAIAKDEEMGRHERIEFRTFLFGVTSRMCRAVPSMTPQELSRAAWACGKLTHKDDMLLSHVFSKAYRRMERFDVQQLSNMLWGLGKAQHQPPVHMLDILLRHVARTCDADNAEHLGKLVYGLGLLAYQPEPEWLAWMERMTRPVLRCFHPVQLVHLLCALSRLEHRPHHKWLDTALDTLEAGLNVVDVHELTSLICALKSIMYHPGDEFMEVWYTHTSKVVQELELQEVLDGMTAIIQLGEDNAPDVYIIALLVVAHEKRAAMTAADHARLLHGITQLIAGWTEEQRLGVLGTGNPVLVDLAATTQWKLSQAAGPDLVTLVSAFASIQHNPGMAWLRKHEAACSSLLKRLTVDEQQALMQAYSRLGHVWGRVSFYAQY